MTSIANTPEPPGMAHDAVSLMWAVLDATYKGGAHLKYSDGEFWCFDRTHWIALSDEQLGSRVLQQLSSAKNRGNRPPRTTIREVIDLLRMRCATNSDRSRLDDQLPIINVVNGELWIAGNGTVELRPHDAASRLRYCLDVVYDPSATCPRYDGALAEIFSVSSPPTDLVDFWHEITGYVLQPTRPDARIFVGWGAGNDGKSALTGLLVRLLGRDRVAAMPVGKLASNSFMLGHLADKALFLDDDVAVGTMLPDGLLKTVSEAKIVTGELKHRDPVEFQVRALPLLLCNPVPHLRDTSYGFRRRLTVIPFERQFKDAEADRTLFPHIRERELSGVLNRALTGLQRVVERGWRFDPPHAVTAATEAWWTQATGEGAPRSPSPHRLAPPKRELTASSPTPVARNGQQIPREARPAATKSSHGITVSVDLPEGGKGCTVQVEAGAAAVVARVFVRSAQNVCVLVDQPIDGR